MEYQKPPLTFEQQLQLLIDRGLVVYDKEIALSYLQRISYYRLSAYFLPFKLEEQFKRNVTFDQVVNLYTFDSRLRLLVLEAIETIEIAIRTQIIYYLSHHYGAFGYIDPKNFSNRFNHAEWLKNLKDAVDKSIETFIRHFKIKYVSSADLPLWMVLEIVSFGSLSKLFKGLQSKDQKVIAKKYNVEDTVLCSWLHVLVYVRNICAHHARLWNRTLTFKPLLPKKLEKFKSIDNSKMFCLLSLLSYLHDQMNGDTTWKKKLYFLIEEYPNISLPSMGFPINWKGWSP